MERHGVTSFCRRVNKKRRSEISYLNRPLSSRQMKKRKLGHEGLVPESKGSQAL